MVKSTSRKSRDVLYNNEGDPVCPHCGACAKFRPYKYGVSKKGYWFKKICANCNHYAMFYCDKNFNKITATQMLLFY